MFKFKSNSKEIKKALERAGLKGITKACLLVESQAKTLAPVDTGQLRGSITHKTENAWGQTVGEVGTPVEYAANVEFGTVHQKEQPYLRPAFRESKKNIEDILGQALGEEVGK